METYVHGETEVRKTGRIATKPMMGGKTLEMVEITPVSEFDGNWKKFVNPSSLLTIVDTTAPVRPVQPPSTIRAESAIPSREKVER